jgi:hypothetical protein
MVSIVEEMVIGGLVGTEKGNTLGFELAPPV